MSTAKQTMLLGFGLFVVSFLTILSRRHDFSNISNQRMYLPHAHRHRVSHYRTKVQNSEQNSTKEEPKWMTIIREQQATKKRFRATMKLNTSEIWTNNKPTKDCNDTRFLNKSLTHKLGKFNRRVALASFPGSGNTWLRHLFHVTTGIWTGSIYFDTKLYSGGFPGEASDCRDPSVFAVKVHDAMHSDVMKCYFDEIILVLRNPYNSILSEFNRRKGASHVAVADEEEFLTSDWERYAKMKINSFNAVLQRWLELCSQKSSKHRCHITAYQDLVQNTTAEMAKILKHLGLPPDRLRCLDIPGFKDGPFHRKRTKTTHNTNRTEPLCLLTQGTQELLSRVVADGKEKLLNLRGGREFAKELDYQLPTC